MENNRKSYRIRTVVGNGAPPSISVNLNQTYDTVEVLSLEINQENFYKMPSAGYGVIVGRVLANGGFGIPNAKVSVFIPYDRDSLIENGDFLYHYTSSMSKDSNGVRYNLLPRDTDDECHQDVGTMYEKEYLLDNRDLIQVFDKYYKYTAITNEGGDYFIYGVPVGTQTIHVDLDLSDIGVLSQRPRDMIYKGYNVNQFESPNKFKKDKNLNSLAQIYSQDRAVTVYPFWGDTSADLTNGTITRCDISVDYKFEPTCVFMGSIVSDTGSRAISQRCVPDDEIGKMSELVTGEGKIEMIRKTFDGKVEEFPIRSNELIDGDGVWCYQIPMNLDYVTTDEFGNMVPTDNPEKGIPTRARVRFRISMNETETDETARKRARFLVPNNPRLNSDYPDFNRFHEADYEFGTFTKEESYRDLFWNKVYTVKSYIPRLQKAKALRRRVHTGIKSVNHSGANNPIPYNNLFVRLTFMYRFLCLLMKIFCVVVYGINTVLGGIGVVLYYIGRTFHKLSGSILTVLIKKCTWEQMAHKLLMMSENITIKLENFCDDGNFDTPTYVPIGKLFGLDWQELIQDACHATTDYDEDENSKKIILDRGCMTNIGVSGGYTFPSIDCRRINFDLGRLFNCIENQLAQDQECTSFNFNNDWINGVLYAPLWFRKIKPKRKIFFNLIPVKSKDKWCDGTSTKFAKGLSLCQTCAQKRTISSDNMKIMPIVNQTYNPSSINSVKNEEACYGFKCHKKTVSFINVEKGLIVPKETMLGENVYYYKSVEYDNTSLRSQTDGDGDIKLLFATDIVLLGSLNNCDSEGVPQFFTRLEGTTYNMPPDLLIMDYESDSEKLKFEQRAGSDSSASVIDSQIGYGALAELPEEIDENDALGALIYTDTTGADWGNYGKDQVDITYNGEENTIYSYLFSNKNEQPDYGGLFYGLTCWSAYTKPKSCVNLSRICEYGVSLDETQSYPEYNTFNGDFEYRTIAPDGFVSYDELYDNDGRAMFATMNGNNLRTKMNPKNGFQMYDFMYLYPENFDGTMRGLMNVTTTPTLNTPQNGNYNLENNSEAYVRFRYGRNRDDSKVIQFYDSTQKLGMYPKGTAQINRNRFPKYENSFYFYFGLVPGNTAIDKFRTLYYSECKDSDGEQSVVTLEYEANNWCTEVTFNEGEYVSGDGWLKIDATYVEAPYTLEITNMSGDSEFFYESPNPLTSPKLFISNDRPGCTPYGIATMCFDDYVNGTSSCDECEGYPPEGYEWLTDEDGRPFGLVNGTYRIRITDANGEVYSQNIDFVKPFIKAKISRAPFRYKNSEIAGVVSELGELNNTNDMYLNIASLGGREGEDMSDREIGGFVKVTDVTQDGSDIVDFSVEVESLFKFDERPSIISGTSDMAEEYATRVNSRYVWTSYEGSYLEVHQDMMDPSETPPEMVHTYDETFMNPCADEIPPYCPYTYDCPQYPELPTLEEPTEFKINDGRYDLRFGVPKGGERYRVRVTMLCRKEIGDGEYKWFKTRNSISTAITVPEPIPFKMLLNGVDYEYIKGFNTGWEIGDNFQDSYNPTQEGVSDIVGWDDVTNIDGIEPLELLDENSPVQDYTYLNYLDIRLSFNKGDELPESCPLLPEDFTSPYTWSGDYIFNPSNIITGIQSFNTVPVTIQSDIWLIRVRQPHTSIYYYYEWDENDGVYVPYGEGNVETISLQEYFNHCHNLGNKNDVITALNGVVTMRKEFVAQVGTAFILYNQKDEYSLNVSYSTYETPVKTLIYYAPDGDDGTSDTVELLDGDNYVNNVCYGITVPTLTGTILEDGEIAYPEAPALLSEMGGVSFEVIGYDENEEPIYKKPMLVGIKNALNETLPTTLTNFYTLPNEDGENDNIPFGVHIVDKRLALVYNSWNCVREWPYFYEESLYGGSMSGQIHVMPSYVSRNGLFLTTYCSILLSFLCSGSLRLRVQRYDNPQSPTTKSDISRWKCRFF